jgi:hypothetical protein
MRLLASEFTGVWRHTTRWKHRENGALIVAEQYKVLTADERKEYKREYAVATGDTVKAGDSLLVTKSTGELAVMVLTQQIATRAERDGSVTTVWHAQGLDPHTGEPVDATTSTATTTLI